MLNDWELKILTSTLEAMVQTSDPTDLALLQLLTQEQKVQLWAVVPVELRQSIHKLKRLSP